MLTKPSKFKIEGKDSQILDVRSAHMQSFWMTFVSWQVTQTSLHFAMDVGVEQSILDAWVKKIKLGLELIPFGCVTSALIQIPKENNPYTIKWFWT